MVHMSTQEFDDGLLILDGFPQYLGLASNLSSRCGLSFFFPSFLPGEVLLDVLLCPEALFNQLLQCLVERLLARQPHELFLGLGTDGVNAALLGLRYVLTTVVLPPGIRH